MGLQRYKTMVKHWSDVEKSRTGSFGFAIWKEQPNRLDTLAARTLKKNKERCDGLYIWLKWWSNRLIQMRKVLVGFEILRP